MKSWWEGASHLITQEFETCKKYSVSSTQPSFNKTCYGIYVRAFIWPAVESLNSENDTAVAPTCFRDKIVSRLTACLQWHHVVMIHFWHILVLMWCLMSVLMAECHESDARDQHSLLPDESQPPLLDTEGSHIQRWGSIHFDMALFTVTLQAASWPSQRET